MKKINSKDNYKKSLNSLPQKRVNNSFFIIYIVYIVYCCISVINPYKYVLKVIQNYFVSLCTVELNIKTMEATQWKTI